MTGVASQPVSPGCHHVPLTVAVAMASGASGAPALRYLPTRPPTSCSPLSGSMMEAGLFHHVVYEHRFEDDYLFYRWGVCVAGATCVCACVYKNHTCNSCACERVEHHKGREYTHGSVQVWQHWLHLPCAAHSGCSGVLVG